jgi:hypothetical protein
MSESDHDYFMRRAAEERAAAEYAGSAEAERSHRELAVRYEAAAAAALGAPVVQFRIPPERGAQPSGEEPVVI